MFVHVKKARSRVSHNAIFCNERVMILSHVSGIPVKYCIMGVLIACPLTYGVEKGGAVVGT